RPAVRRMARPHVRDRRRATDAGRRKGGRAVRLSICVLLAALSAALMASSAGGAASFVSAANCVEHQAFVDGDDAAVAARLPKHYTAVRDSATGRPLVFARALHCEKGTLGGQTAPITLASIGVVIESPDGVG